MRNKFLTTRNAMLAVLSVLLVLCLTFGLILLPNKANAEGENSSEISIWNGDLEAAGWADTETVKAPAPDGYSLKGDNTLEIGSAEALAYFAHEVYADSAHALDGFTVKLTCDIDLGGDENIWIPIGTTQRSNNPDYRFSGTFDGNGHSIYNLTSTGFYENISYDAVEGYYIAYGNDIKIPFNTDKGEYAYGLFGVTMNMTVTNLKMSGVEFTLRDISELDSVVLPYTLIADSVGAIIGYNQGSLYVADCEMGILLSDNSLVENYSDSRILIETVGNSAVGGLVGRAYGLKSNASADENLYSDIKIERCVNNLSFYYSVPQIEGIVETIEECGKVSGIIGYSTYFKNFEVSDCINYGNIDGGQFAGGIVAFFTDASVKNTAEHIDEDWYFTIKNCENYGNITSSDLDSDVYTAGPKTHAGGIISSLGASTENCDSASTNSPIPAVNMYILNCSNYGIISAYNTEAKNGDSNVKGTGWNTAGGILGYLFPSETGETRVTDCFNYGEIISVAKSGSEYYTPKLGGMIGWLYYYWGNINGEKPDERAIDFSVTGGNCGAVSGETSRSNNIHGLIGLNTFPNKQLTEVNLINSYAIAGVTDTGISNTAKTDYGFEEFLYDESNSSVITGIKFGGTGDIELIIPASVTKIADGAFAGIENIVSVTFAENGLLTEIGNWAFAGTGITEVEIPASVEVIGAAAFGGCPELVSVTFAGNKVEAIGQSAFGNCEKINYVELPENTLQIEFGKTVFNSNGNVYLIVENRAYYDALISALDEVAEFENLSGLAVYAENITYRVTINYNRGNTNIGNEYRLYGTDYTIAFDGNAWLNAEINSVGTNALKDLKWYYDSKIVSVDRLSTLLVDADGYTVGDSITLFTEYGDKFFEARSGLVFDENKTYTTSELNELLTGTSDKIEAGMTVAITGYTSPDGTEGVRTVIHDAGTYTILINLGDGSEHYELKITIARQLVDLGEYSRLSWRIQGFDSSTELRDMTLYIYTYRNNGNEYPSNSVLTADQISKLGLNSNYTIRTVTYSVIRYSGNTVTIGIIDNPAYTVQSYGGTYSTKGIGKYTATANLTANPNYEIIASPSSSLRGLEIEISDNGISVTKTWYIVSISNWLVNSNGSDYTVNSSFTYGSLINVSAPQLKYNNYDGTQPLTFYLELYLNGIKVGTVFDPADISYYINSSMPAGEYRLVVTVGEVNSLEWDDDVDPEHSSEPTLYVTHAGFTESFTFTVNKKVLQSLNAFHTALNGSEFVYKWDDGKAHLWEQSEEVQSAYNIFLNSFVNPARTGIWNDVKYDNYYGDPVLSYNLIRMQSTLYYEYVSTGDADTYTVYYKVSAPNYYDSLETLTGTDTRFNYYFTVINVREISLPILNEKTYTGELLKADVILPADDDGNPLYYTVLTNNGGVNAGTYEVVLKLLDPVHYMWAGQTLGNTTETISVDFNIEKYHDNYFTVTPSVTTWVVGKYAVLEEFPVTADARFGRVVITLSYSEDIEDIIYQGANGTAEFANALAGLKEGSYILTATVADSDNFNGLSKVITFRVFEKDGLPWWAVLLIVVGVLGVVVLVFFILHQKGVLQMLTGRFIIAMRTKATVDATIAAVRANKVAAAAKISIAKAEEEDRLAEERASEPKNTAKSFGKKSKNKPKGNNK